MIGRKPKPVALKLLEGNPGKRPIPKTEPKPSLSMPEAPATLEGDSLAEWMRVVPEVYRLGMMTHLDVPALTCWCLHVGELAEAVRELRSAPKDKRRVLADHRRRVSDASERIRKWASEFGFTPSSRSRIVAIPRDGEDKKAKDIIGW